MDWARDDSKVKHFTSCANIGEWMKQLSDDALNGDNIRLAIEASIAANQAPVGYLHTERSKQPLRDLGAMLRASWSFSLSREASRRTGAEQKAT